jgi:hypothetical protein
MLGIGLAVVACPSDVVAHDVVNEYGTPTHNTKEEKVGR